MAINQDPEELDNRRLASIASNPKHPLHTHAKSIMDRRKNAQKEHTEHMGEGAMKRMATAETEPKPAKKKGMETYKKMKKKMDEAMLTRKQISRAAAIGASKAKPKDQVSVAKAPWEKDKKEVKEYGGPPISREKYLKQKPMGEKTLTSNEKKKREEIAQAMKRDNPDMPMAKKMAIATAQAKKVAESDVKELSLPTPKTGLSKAATGSVDKDKLKKDLERLKKGVNEVSSNKLFNYMRKSAADAGKPGATARSQDKRIGGQKKADDKIRAMQGKRDASHIKVPASMSEDDAGARMYKDNPEMMKQQGPGGFKSLAPKAKKAIKKRMKTMTSTQNSLAAISKRANENVEEGSARNRLLAIVNKAGNRTMADREADAKKATERRKAADKDLADFRKKNIGMS